MLCAGFVLLGYTRALVDDFGEIIDVGDTPVRTWDTITIALLLKAFLHQP
jgi:hypothetical protein